MQVFYAFPAQLTRKTADNYYKQTPRQPGWKLKGWKMQRWASQIVSIPFTRHFYALMSTCMVQQHLFYQRQEYKTVFVTPSHTGMNTWATPILQTDLGFWTGCIPVSVHGVHPSPGSVTPAGWSYFPIADLHPNKEKPGKLRGGKKNRLAYANSQQLNLGLHLFVCFSVWEQCHKPSHNDLLQSSGSRAPGQSPHRAGQRLAPAPWGGQGCGVFHATDWWPDAHTSTAANDSNR